MNGLFHNDIGVFGKALEMTPKGGTASPEGDSRFQVGGVCSTQTLRFWLSLYLEKCDFATLHCTIFPQKTPNFGQIGSFLRQIFHKKKKKKNQKKTTQFYIWAHCSVAITHPSIYLKWWKCTSNPWHIPVYQQNVRTSPRLHPYPQNSMFCALSQNYQHLFET